MKTINIFKRNVKPIDFSLFTDDPEMRLLVERLKEMDEKHKEETLKDRKDADEKIKKLKEESEMEIVAMEYDLMMEKTKAKVLIDQSNERIRKLNVLQGVCESIGGSCSIVKGIIRIKENF